MEQAQGCRRSGLYRIDRTGTVMKSCVFGGLSSEMRAKEKWLQLCEQAAREQDSNKLMELVDEVNRLLLEEEERVKGNRARNDVPDSRAPKPS
jgi:hypothetical protein